MHRLQLPAAHSKLAPAFQDLVAAERWLAAQAANQPWPLLSALTGQIEAIDAAALPPPLSLQLLDRLRSAALPVQASQEARYNRKALPLTADEQQVFAMAQRLWRQLGIAYLRLAPHFAGAEKCRPLHRAANAIRLAQFTCYQASQACPPELDHLLLAILAQAESAGVLRQALGDPDYPHLGEANIAGLLSWAILLRLADPYHFSSAQLAVANRALSRWRELCTFQSAPDSDRKTLTIPLAPLFGGPLPAGLPGWLNVRSVDRKIRSRIESLRAGEAPEALKLGRELSAAACIRLLSDIDHHLRTPAPAPSQASGEIELAFGAEDAYAIFTGEELNPGSGMNARSTSIAHQRMALFGFDSLSQMPTAVQRIDVPSETWARTDGQVTRLETNGPRLQAPCLIATLQGDQPRLGVLSRLLATADGQLHARLDWYPEQIEACTLKKVAASPPGQPRHAAFVLRSGSDLSLLVPVTAGVRLDIGVALECASVVHLVPREVIERGADFVRYACRPA